MALHFSACSRANLRTLLLPPHMKRQHLHVSTTVCPGKLRGTAGRSSGIRVSNEDSYPDTWKNAMDSERKEIEFQKIVENSGGIDEEEEEESPDALEWKTDQFKKILEVPKEERDRIQRMQVIDRASAAIAAARALLEESSTSSPKEASVDLTPSGSDFSKPQSNGEMGVQAGGMQGGNLLVPQSGTSGLGTPGPDFWSWTPPQDSNRNSEDTSKLQTTRKPTSDPIPTKSLMEKEQSVGFLSIPFESTISGSNQNPPLPPLQSFVDIKKMDLPNSNSGPPSHELGEQFSTHAAEAADALDKVSEMSSYGVNPDGSRWWKETGIEQRPDGVVCRWTLTRGVSSDEHVEWEEKFWEAADQFDYKELGSEKSGRDAGGNVWREYWKESMWQDIRSGLVHVEKTADKWGNNGKGDEWHEKWWEHYDATGQAEKCAHKWCSIDPNTPLEAGHAHVWHERWGEEYDGQGGSMKYTDKWAERLEGDGWTKWGDKWDENFDPNGHGVKQGETWWEGKQGERWNRTWGERHNGTGWVHKYGKSSSGEHWDTHVKQDTWYERYPHFGFEHCIDHSVQLHEVRKPSETS
ncbi:hypothetical protein HHK36_020562 [Tetracentron sinense]|uniref:Uncharacterized protein n=1 Tax=Tetracentron sinense TaxID=13715 RepID=A0A835DBQ7_TETSI|nr:hypothetical protein HHK36_020562 [Tetracentron sinense]